MLDGMHRVLELPNDLRHFPFNFGPTHMTYITESAQLARVAAIGLFHHVHSGNSREHRVVTCDAREMKRCVEHIGAGGQRGPEPQFEVG
jgi:hypothetical protein